MDIDTGLTGLLDIAPSVPQGGLTDEDRAWKARHSGIAGVGRDILGNLGDFLLKHLGLHPMYADSQHQHELNYAFDQAGGNSDDPSAQLAGAQAVRAIDFNAGNNLVNTTVDNQRQQAAIEAAKANRDALLQLKNQQEQDRHTRVAQNALNGITDADHYNKVRAQLVKAYPELDGDISKDFDPDLNAAYVQGGNSVTNQIKQDQNQERIDNQSDQFDTRNATTIRGQDLAHGDRVRGQDMSASTAAARTQATIHGQDLTHEDRVAAEAGRNSRENQSEAGKDARQNSKVTQTPVASRFVEGRVYVQNGHRYQYSNGQFKAL